MNIILDVQGFNIEDKKFVVKELACYDGTRISHYIFKPPFPFHHLPPELHRQATWLINNHHCIHWNEGFTPLYKCADIIKNLSSHASYVYVKGSEKADYVRKFSNKPVIELDEQPSLQKMDSSCFYHNKSPCICALSNVFFLYNQIFM